MGWTAADAVDYKGFPADKSKTGGWVPAALILGLFSLHHVHVITVALFLSLSLILSIMQVLLCVSKNTHYFVM